MSTVVTPEPPLHRAARIEDAFHRWRERRGRKRGLVPTIVPYTAYGSTSWVRVLCRVVLRPPDAAAPQRAEKVRGWRSFFSIPVLAAPIPVVAGTGTHVVTADRGGVVDTRVDADLEPGWHELALSAEGTEPVSASVFIVDPAAG